MSYSEYIWNYFKSKIGNEYGVAGLMGNLQAESGLCPYRLQGDFTSGYATSATYTANVDSGVISEYDFVHNGPNGGGYGLAQWTYYSRKQGLYNLWKSGGYSSIGSIDLACDWLWHELQVSYSGVLSVLQNATSIRQASDSVLHDFESPADQSTAVEELRASNSQHWYDTYSGTGGGTVDPDPDPPVTPDPDPDPPVTPDPDPPEQEVRKRKAMSFIMMMLATRR